MLVPAEGGIVLGNNSILNEVDVARKYNDPRLPAQILGGTKAKIYACISIANR